MLALFKQTFREWGRDDVPTHGAALAYYTLFAVAPLLLISIAMVGAIFGKDAASGEMFRFLREWMGDTTAAFLQDLVRNGNAHPHAGLFSSIVGGVVLLFGASSVFVQLQTSLNHIWHVQTDEGRGLLNMVKSRFLSFGFVLLSGLLLLASLLVSVAIAFAGAWLPDFGGGVGALFQVLNVLVSIGGVTVLLAFIYKFLPETRIAWRDVWVGALLTGVLFTIGKSLVGIYLGRSGVGSIFGAAGSLIAFLVWVYYSAQIIFFGAEFTKVYASRRSSAVTRQGRPMTGDSEMRTLGGL